MTPTIRMMVILMVTLFFLFFISEPSFAQIYNWQDEKGTINVSNNPGTIKCSIEPETPASKKVDKTERDRTLSDRSSQGNSVIMLAQRQFLIIDGKKYELSPGPRYYDAHPEERARDTATQANKPLMDMQEKLIEDMRTREQGYGAGSYRDYSSPSSPPPPPPVPSTPGVLIQRPGGAISAETGEFYPKSGRGLIDPKTGGFLPDVGRGYIDPSTGTFIPKR